MRKSIFLILFALLGVLSARAYDFEVDGIYYNFIAGTDDQVAVTYGSSPTYTDEVVIPPIVTYSGNTYRVTSIGIYAFDGCSGLTSVTIGESVTSIGESAFYECSGLTSATIPNSVTSIGNSAFSGCSGLTSVTIPEGVTSIGDYTFYNCSGLTSMTIPESVTSIGRSAFEGCRGLTSVTIPNSVTSIGVSAFYGCSGLTSVTIPESVTSIGTSAFSGCSGLTSVTIPNGVTDIGSRVFEGCSGLKSVTIPESVTYIGSYAFNRCSGLTSVTIPESVTYIGSYAFYNCSGLTSVTIPESVTIIGACAFRNCSGLTSVTIPESVTSIESSAFRDCTSLTSVTSLPQDPPVCSFSVFSDYSATLFVPYGSKEAYQTAQEWSEFGTILELCTVTVQPNDAAMGSVSGGDTYAFGTEATLTASPSTGYHFVKWNDGNTSNPRTLTVSGDLTLTAIFAPLVEVTLSATEGGTVSGGGDYELNEQVTITATPNEGYRFVNWTKGNEVFATDSMYTFTVTEDLELTANFLKTFTVAVSANNADWGTATLTGNSPYDTAASVTITATPNEGYRFINWTKGNEVFATDSMYTFAVTENLTLVANFEEIPPVVVVKTYTVSVSANNAAWGSVSQSGTGTYDSAATVTITATPNEGYRFINWTKGNEVFATDSLHTFIITENLELLANFEKMPDTPIDPDIPTANESPEVDNLRVYVQDRTIHLSEDRGTVQVYNMAGQRIYNGHTTAIPVRQSGVYILAVGQQRIKVLVR